MDIAAVADDDLMFLIRRLVYHGLSWLVDALSKKTEMNFFPTSRPPSLRLSSVPRRKLPVNLVYYNTII